MVCNWDISTLFLICFGYVVWGIPNIGKHPIPQSHELPNEEFPFHAPLDDAYDLYWTFSEEDITFEVHVQTDGWAGFGISPSGGMDGADLIIGWIDQEGEQHFDDRHGVGKELPPIDEQQDWLLMLAEKVDTKLVLRFTRKLDICNEEDLPIEEGTVRVIWAYNPSPMYPGEEPAYHGSSQRGTRSLQLLLFGNTDANLPNDTVTWDFKMPNITLPAQGTYYYCQLFKVPRLPQKYHAIRFEPIYTPGNELLLHHLDVYNCQDDMDEVGDAGHECWVPGMPSEMHNCDVFWFAWSIGEEGVDYPLHTGFLFDPDDHPGSLMMQIHYDNPELQSGRFDSSGLRLYLTPTLREFNSGILAVGTLFYPTWPELNLAIPPHSKAFRLYNHCPAFCLQEAMDEEEVPMTNIKAYGLSLHAHLAGAKIFVRHFRGDEELPPLMIDTHYDFNFQRYIFFKEDVIIYPTDKIETICEWDTTDRTEVSWGGPASTDEMCQAFILYYPRFHMSLCCSEPSADQFLKVVDIVTEPLSHFPYYRVIAPEEYVNNSQLEIFNQLDWSDPCLRERLERVINEGEVDSWFLCTTRKNGFIPIKQTFSVQSDMEIEDRTCGWHDDNTNDDTCFNGEATTEDPGGEATEDPGNPDNGGTHSCTTWIVVLMAAFLLNAI